MHKIVDANVSADWIVMVVPKGRVATVHIVRPAEEALTIMNVPMVAAAAAAKAHKKNQENAK